MRKDKPTSIADQLKLYQETIEKRQKYVKNEFQAYGLELAKELGDWKNRSLYIRLAKNTDKKIEKTLTEEKKEELKTPAEIKKMIEKNRFTGYYKTKLRFIN